MESQRLSLLAQLEGSGAIAQDGGTAAGKRAVFCPLTMVLRLEVAPTPQAVKTAWLAYSKR